MAKNGRKYAVALVGALALAILLARSGGPRPGTVSTGKVLAVIQAARTDESATRRHPTVPARAAGKLMSVEDFLARKDLCVFFNRNLNVGPKEAFDRLMKAPDLVPHETSKDQAYLRVLEALLGATLEQRREKLGGEEETDPIVLLYRGLLEGGMMVAGSDGWENGEPSVLQAIRDLEKARELDPGNGVYSLYLARLKEQRGFPADEIRRELLQAGAAPRFETYLLPLIQRVFEKGMNNPQLWVLSNVVIASFPIPDYQPWRLFADKLNAGADPELAESAMELGKHMMEPTQTFGLEREAVYWMGVEHQVGWNLFKQGWNKARPDEEVPPDLKTYQDWIKHPESVIRMSNYLDPVTCSNAWMKAIYDRDRSFFVKRYAPSRLPSEGTGG